MSLVNVHVDALSMRSLSFTFTLPTPVHLRRWVASTLPALMMRGGALVISVLGVRLVAPFLGQNDLGTYAVIQSIAAWTALAALGLPEACSGLLGKFHHAGRYSSGKRYVDTSFRLIAATAGALSLTILFASAAAIATGASDLWQTLTVAVTASLWLLALPFGLAQAPLNADGLIARTTAWNFGIAAAGFSAIWLVTASGALISHRLFALSAAVALTNLVARWVMYQVETRRRYGASARLAGRSRRRTTALLKSSYPFVVISLAALAAFQIDRLIAYQLLSPADTAVLDVTLKVFLAVYGLYGVVVARLWKSIGSAWNAGDRRTARRVVLRAFVGALGFWLVVGAAISACIATIVNVFTHGTITAVHLSFVTAVAIFTATRGSIDTVTISIFAIRKQRETLTTVISHGILNIPLSIAGCKMFGLTGLIYGQLVALLLTSGWRFPMIFWRATMGSR